MGCDHSEKIPPGRKREFQSTHPRGVRPEIRNFVLGFISFQSTHPRGVRRWNFFTVFLDFQISIHAPTWGATPYEGFDRESEEFQSTHPRGVRLEVSSERRDVLLFQSTHPRGVRLERNYVLAVNRCISIHAPTWGATQWSNERYSSLEFQSTHPRGVRQGRLSK